MNYTVILSCSILLITSIVSFICGYHKATDIYQNKYYKQLEVNRELEQEWQDKQYQLMTDYEQQIKELKDAQTEEVQTVVIADVSNTTECVHDKATTTTVPTKTKDSTKLKCYTESELLNKIKASLAIAAECDQLAIKYNTLLKACSNED